MNDIKAKGEISEETCRSNMIEILGLKEKQL